MPSRIIWRDVSDGKGKAEGLERMREGEWKLEDGGGRRDEG
jgi:hypothetical protein